MFPLECYCGWGRDGLRTQKTIKHYDRVKNEAWYECHSKSYLWLDRLEISWVGWSMEQLVNKNYKSKRRGNKLRSYSATEKALQFHVNRNTNSYLVILFICWDLSVQVFSLVSIFRGQASAEQNSNISAERIVLPSTLDLCCWSSSYTRWCCSIIWIWMCEDIYLTDFLGEVLARFILLNIQVPETPVSRTWIPSSLNSDWQVHSVAQRGANCSGNFRLMKTLSFDEKGKKEDI